MRPTTELLQIVPLLSDLDEAELQQMSAYFRIVALRAGQTLCAEGSKADSACFVVKGELDALAKLPGGGETKVGTILPGAIIGETALLGDGLRTASVRARTDSQALEVSSAFFRAALGQMDRPAYKILRRVIRGLADRLSQVRERILEQMDGPTLEGMSMSTGATRPVGNGRQQGTAFDILPFLALLSFFRGFSASECERVLGCGKIVAQEKGCMLYDEGSAAGSGYLVIRGSVACTAWRNGERQLSVIGPGRICGANEMISGRDRQDSAVTRARSVLLELDNTAFERLFTGDTAECFKFQNAIGVSQVRDLRSANNLLALLVNLAHIRARPRLASVS